MYVCLCMGITDQDIIDELDQGARNLKDVSKRLGVGSQCGRCCQTAKEVVADYQSMSQMMALAYSAA